MSYAFVVDDTGYARFAGKYMVEMPLEIGPSEQVTIDGLSARRIDVRTSYKLDRTRSDLILRHEVVLCRDQACQSLTVECSRVRDGRTIEVFLGHLVVRNRSFWVDGDRTYQRMCQ